MRYLSVCSGIEAATAAWHPLGWKAAAFSEIEPFPRAVLTHHYPDTPLHGDFTTIGADEYGPIDLLVGGTPCQSFSVAGLRGGIHDSRGNLALEYLRLLDRTRPRWMVWENVPGVYSATSDDAPDHGDDGDGRWEDDADESHAFACFLAGLRELGYHGCYRTLDAQYFGVPQRRRRVFVVGHLGDWRRAAAVLFERHSLSGHPAPRREKRQRAARPTARSVAIRGRDGTPQAELGDEVANAILTPNGGRAGVGVGAVLEHCPDIVPQAMSSKWSKGSSGPAGDECANLIAHCLRAEGFDASEDGTGRGTPIIPIDMRQASRGATMTNNRAEGSSGGAPGTGIGEDGDPSPTVSTSHVPAVVFAQNQRDELRLMDVAGALAAEPGMKQQTYIAQSAVRRLTPRECERLQGFPDDYTLIPYRGKPAADGPRYKALGNSMAVPVMRWIGERIAMVEAINQQRDAA